MIDLYAVTFQRSNGGLYKLELMAENREQALYAALELFPDWRVVRCCRGFDWETDHHGQTPAGHQPLDYC
jgi:hypothetical protein